MTTAEHFWTRRVRWRLLGAWRWPLFGVFTVGDAFIAHALSPTGGHAKVIPSMIIASFANLFLIGLIAPWLARRIVERQGAPVGPPTFPPENHLEFVTDRIASAALVIAALGLLATGLASQHDRVCVTNRVCSAGDAVRAYVNTHAPAEVRARVDAENTYPLQEDGFFRICVPYNDARKQYCMFVDTKRRPPSVVYDHDSRPNQQYFHTPAPG